MKSYYNSELLANGYLQSGDHKLKLSSMKKGQNFFANSSTEDEWI